MKLRMAPAALLTVLPFSAQAFQLPRFPGATSPPQQQQQQQQQQLQLQQQQPEKEQQKPGSYTKTSPVLKAAVGLLTDGLNNVARQEASLSSPGKVVARLSPTALKQKIEADYKAAYFLTGAISPEAYDEDCVFTDPTLSFTGLATWSRNINNLKIFFRDPRLDLQGIKLDTSTQTVNTQWRLTCELALPWRPFIDVKGGTLHRYDPQKGGKVVEHVESWSISGFAAVLQLFKPGNGRPSSSSSLLSPSLSKAKASFHMLASTILPLSLSLLSSFPSSLSSSPSSFVVHAAEDRRQVADIPASGLVFKDTINVEAFQDPKVKGVTLYVSDFKRPITERLVKDFFSDPSQASVACVRTGPVLKGDIDTSKQGEEVFSEARSLLFKTIRVRRVYDKDAQALIYVSYSTRFNNKDDDNKSRFKSSICAIPLDQEAPETK